MKTFPLFLFLFLTINSFAYTKSIIYTSDLHVSQPKGRYFFMTKRYKKFLKTVHKRQHLYIFNGDFIDNAYIQNNKVHAGKYQYQTNEINYFFDITKQFINLKQNKLLLNFGAGHDFGDLLLTQYLTKQQYIGKYRWGKKIDLIWFTVKQSAFNNNHKKSHVLSSSEYKLLDLMLSQTDHCILFSHIPLRTDITYQYGKWSHNKNLTIPLSDPLYTLIKKYKQKIIAVFSGHIHHTYQTSYQGIPLYSFPLIDNNSYCEIKLYSNYIKIIPKNSHLKTQKIHFMDNNLLYNLKSLLYITKRKHQ